MDKVGYANFAKHPVKPVIQKLNAKLVVLDYLIMLIRNVFCVNFYL